MYATSTITFEGNIADDINVRENNSGGMYVDLVVLVSQGRDDRGQDRPATRWYTRLTGRLAENAANLTKGTRLVVVGSVVTDSWPDKTTGEIRYATRVLAQSIGVALTFARVTGIDRNPRKTIEPTPENQAGPTSSTRSSTGTANDI